MTDTYKDKTVRQIEAEFDELTQNHTAYAIAKTGKIAEAMLSKAKKGIRKISLDKKIEVLEAFFDIKN